MVDRTSQPFNLEVGREASQGLNLGAGRYRAPKDQGMSSMDQALSGILDFGQKLAGKAVDLKAEEAYMAGQRARMAGESADAVESDVFSKPFVKGGYQDEDYRIAQAELAREMQVLLQGNGKAMSPQDFSKTLQEAAKKYQPRYENLSLRGKAQALESQRALEQSLFAKHAAAYQQFIIDQGMKRYNINGNQILDDLLKAGPVDRDAQAERAGLFYQDLLTTDKLPADVRVGMAKEFVLSMANADQREVVESFRTAGLLDQLPFEERRQLDSALRESAVRTEAKDSLGVVLNNAEVERRVAGGEVTAEELQLHINAEVAAGRMSYDQAKTLAGKYVTGLSNKDDMLDIFGAIGRGDLTTLAALGVSPVQGLEKLDQQLAKNGVGTTERMVYGIQQGTKLGVLPQSYGETMAAAVRHVQIADDNMNTELVGTLNASVSALIAAEQANPGARGVLLAAMPDDTKVAMSYALDQAGKGIQPAEALKEYAANRDAFANLDSLKQAMQTQTFKDEVRSRVDAMATSGFWGRIGNFVTGQSNLSTNPRNAALLETALRQELNSLTSDRRNMGASAEALLDVAAANVKARTIEVGAPGIFGTGEQRRPLILPRGVTPAMVFDGETNTAAIGQVLAEELEVPDGFEAGFAWNPVMGRLERVVYNSEGIEAERTVVDAPSVGRRVKARNESLFEEARAAHFGGEVEINGVKVVIDGTGSQGIPVRQVREFRQELAEMEGVKLEVYKDRNGLAVGIGRNVTGQMKEGDTITAQQASQWFREDTDAALGAAARLAPTLGVRDRTAITGLAGAIYQLGGAGLGEHKRTAEAIRNRDYGTFVKEVKSSAWAKQTPNRVDWFIKKMAGHFLP